MGQHNIETLTKDLAEFKRNVSRRLGHQDGVLNDMQPKVNAMHDFMVDAQGFERGQSSYKKDGSINISKDVWGIVKWLILVILALAGIKGISS